MSTPQPCPSTSTLAALLTGDLEGDTLHRLASHLETCDACSRKADEWEKESDGDDLVRALRHVGSSVRSTPPSPWLEEAHALHGASSRNLVVSPAGRLTHALADGPVHLGRFTLLEELGHGSFGTVFRAHDPELDRIVAIKVPRSGDLETDAERTRVLREARTVAGLRHPAIVGLYESGTTDDGVHFLVSEYVEGRTLSDLLADHSYTPRDAATLVSHIADAVHDAHVHGVIHRDLKPSNVLIDADDAPHVLDFGLAKRDVGESTVTGDGQILGTPAYMSPEQARGDSHDVDERTDVYSLGVMLYELLTGTPPFRGSRRMLLVQVLEDEPRPPRRLQDGIPRDLETICLRALEKAPSKRYDSARSLADDLRRWLGGDPIEARPVSSAERLWRWCRRNPFAASLFVTLVLGASAAVYSFYEFSKFLVRETALDGAQMQAETLETINAFYSDVLKQVDGTVDVSHDYVGKAQTLPLPATFTIDAGHRIEATKSGLRVRLYSAYPFPIRDGGGPQDDFERRALAVLEQHPDQPFHEYSEWNGRPSVRFAKARVMSESCISCHNEHPSSPKRDWVVGDVRGVLEIIRPLERDHARAQRGLRKVLTLVLGVTALLIAGFAAFFLRRPARDT